MCQPTSRASDAHRGLPTSSGRHDAPATGNAHRRAARSALGVGPRSLRRIDDHNDAVATLARTSSPRPADRRAAWRSAGARSSSGSSLLRSEPTKLEGARVSCPVCGHQNPAGMKFCGECGARLVSGCPACGFQNPPGMRFCGECGRPLAVGAEPVEAGGVRAGGSRAGVIVAPGVSDDARIQPGCGHGAAPCQRALRRSRRLHRAVRRDRPGAGAGVPRPLLRPLSRDRRALRGHGREVHR